MQRKWVHAALMASYQHHFHGHIENEVKRWLMTLLIDPSNFHTNTRELTGRIMSRLTWDDATQGRQHGEEANETLTNMSIHGSLVNAAPFLWHIGDFFGYNPWRKFEVEREGKLKAHWLRSFHTAKRRFLEKDLPNDTWSYRYFDQLMRAGNTTLEQSERDEDVASCMLGFQCMVGIITVATPLMYLMMAMTLHPEWQDKVQEEINSVCGDHMPSLQDYAELPTLRACIKEALRWRSSVPLGKLVGRR
jgi:cytochrome P450